jgi:hypothetical protein
MISTEVDGELICPNMSKNIGLYIYHPHDPLSSFTDGVPEAKLPVAVFMHGVGQQANEYDSLFIELARDGFVVVSIDRYFEDDDAGLAYACALRYLAVAWEPEQEHDILSCDAFFIGHSRGGEAAYLAVDTYASADPVAAMFALRGAVQIAPADNYATGNDRVILGENTVPLLVVTGATDNDVDSQVVNTHELMGPEINLQGNEAGKAIVWAYDVEHDAFGGGGSICISQLGAAAMQPGAFQAEKGAALTSSYVPAFARWHVLGDSSQRAFFTGEAYPEAVLEPAFWDYHPAYEQLTPADCTLLSQTPCEDEPGCWWRPTESDCVRRPLIKHGFTVDARPGEGERVLIDVGSREQVPPELSPAFPGGVEVSTLGFLAGQVEPLDQLQFGFETDFTGPAQPTEVIGIRWGDTGESTSGEVRWASPVDDLTPYSHLSLRVGIASPGSGNNGSCGPVTEMPLSFDVRLSKWDAMGSRTVSVGPLIQQEVQSVGTALALACVGACTGYHFLETVRIPLRSFCQQGPLFFSPTNLEHIALSFPDLGEPFLVAVDTLELTYHPDDDSSRCGMESAAWSCEATVSLAAKESSCTTEPSGGTCPSPNRVTNDVDLPVVPALWSGSAFDGWVVFTGAGFVADPLDPTTDELDAVSQLCVDACVQQWSAIPEIVADCETPGAFATPTLVESPSLGAVHAIAEHLEDGSGLFIGESLACDLESDCCEAFDEDVCHAVPLRPTVAKLPLGHGQERVVAVNHLESEVTSESGMITDTARLSGTVGYSTCRDGNATTCPFYLGSVELFAASSLDVGIECPTGVETVTVDDLEIRLVQPAMGIDQASTPDKAFPVDALVFEGTFEVLGMPYVIRGRNEVPVYLAADDVALEAFGIHLEGAAPCTGGGLGTAYGTLDLALNVRGATVSSPPTVSITVPSAVTCPTSALLLTATASDPDSDLVSVRWYVDDVLLAPTTTVIPFTQAHTLRAVARDARGATTTDVKAVACL